MRAYSVDLRQRVLAALERGMPRQQVVSTFGISLATLKRWMVYQRVVADLTPKRPPGRRPTIRPDQRATLWSQLETFPDATVAQHTRWWNTIHSTALSQWTIGRAIRRLGWTRKKRRWVPPSEMSRPAPRIVGASHDEQWTIL